MGSRRLKLLVALIVITFVQTTAWAQSPRFSYTKIVETGDRAPDGVTFAGFSTVAVNDSGAVAFIAGDNTGLYLLQAGMITPIASTGQAVPGMTGVFYDEITTAAINNRGDIAFVASVVGARTGPVLFLHSAGVVQPLVFSGTQVPGPVFANFQDFLAVFLNENGEVAFTGKFRDTESGAFLYTVGMVQPIAVTNQDAPGTGTQFRAAGAQSLSNDGAIVVVGAVRSSTIQTGLFLHQAGKLQQVFLGGQPIPGVSNDRFLRFGNARQVDPTGTVVFEGSGLFSGGIFTISGTTLRTVIMSNQTAPGTGSKRIVEFFPLTANLAGQCAFNAKLEQEQFALFRYSTGDRMLRSVVVSDQPVTGSFARRYVPSGVVSMNTQGVIVFSGSTLTPGTAGVYQASSNTLTAVVTSQAKAPESRLRLGSDMALNHRGAVAFAATAAGNGAGFYLSQDASVQPLIVKGQAAPGAGEGRINDITNLEFDRTALTEQNELAMIADIDGGTTTQGMFRASPGSLQSVALAGGALPGISQTTFKSFNRGLINNQGFVTLTGFITQRGEDKQALVQHQGRTTVVIAASEQTAPGTGGSKFDSLTSSELWANDTGDVAFIAGLDDGRNGLFLYTNRQITSIALTNQAVPGLNNVTFDSFGCVMINNQKTVAFTAEFSNGASGVFTWANGQLRTVALTGQAVPGVTDRTFTAFGTTAINDSGSVIFKGHWGSFTQGVFLFSSATLTPVALHSQTVPELGNRRFTAFYGMTINNRGEIVFAASLDGAPAPSMVIRAVPQ